MAIYITGSATISPQPTWQGKLEDPVSYTGNRLACIEPDYAPWIAPAQQRRMSRIIKMGVTSALMALKNAGLSQPDGIITGTGFGCLHDTGQFLAQLVGQNETALNPTPFIQSTHNTIGSQIALLLQVQGYNQTYAEDGLSFENALTDSFLHLSEHADQSLLIGGIDELTDYSYTIQNRFGLYRRTISNTLSLFSSPGKGTLAGEGSAWFVVTGKPRENTTCIESISSYYKPEESSMVAIIDRYLSDANVKKKDIDLLILGKSGDAANDNLLDAVATKFSASSIACYKHLCGEYPVSTSFAMWLASKISQSKRLPDSMMSVDRKRVPERILIYNRYFGIYHSLILLKAC